MKPGEDGECHRRARAGGQHLVPRTSSRPGQPRPDHENRGHPSPPRRWPSAWREWTTAESPELCRKSRKKDSPATQPKSQRPAPATLPYRYVRPTRPGISPGSLESRTGISRNAREAGLNQQPPQRSRASAQRRQDFTWGRCAVPSATSGHDKLQPSLPSEIRQVVYHRDGFRRYSLYSDIM